MGRPSFGPYIFSGSATVVETFGIAPFQFVVLDMEHTPFVSFETLVSLIRAAEAAGLSPFVRVPCNDPVLIGKVIELGAMGILVPHIETRADADRAVAASRFVPAGLRGHCPIVRSFDYGLTLDGWNYSKLSGMREAIAREDRDVLIIGMIESMQGVSNLDDILASELDAINIGTNDLSMTMGIPDAEGQMFHPAVLAMRDQLVRHCKAAGKPVMCAMGAFLENGTSMRSAVERWLPEGILMFKVGIDLSFLRARCWQIAQDASARA